MSKSDSNSATKICWRCQCRKHVSEFGKDASRRDGLQPKCRECRSREESSAEARKQRRAYLGEWRKGEAGQRSVRGAKLYHRYGITLEDYDHLLVDQHGGCAICGGLPDSEYCGLLCVDHDHLTGKVRGLLCRACNIAIGAANDKPAVLRDMAKYLEVHDAAYP